METATPQGYVLPWGLCGMHIKNRHSNNPIQTEINLKKTRSHSTSSEIDVFPTIIRNVPQGSSDGIVLKEEMILEGWELNLTNTTFFLFSIIERLHLTNIPADL